MSKFFVFYLTIAFSCAYMAKSQLNFPILKDSYIESNINLIVMLNSTLTFPQLVGINNTVNLWQLIRQTPQSYSTNNLGALNKLTLFYPSKPRGNLASTYVCLPNDTICTQIQIPNFDVSQVGSYKLLTVDSNYDPSFQYQFNVSAFLNQVSLSCSSSNGTACSMNMSSNTLSVIADQPVLISCGVDFVKNDDYLIPAKVVLKTDSYEDCMMDSSSFTPSNNTFGFSSSFNMIMTRMTKTCSRTFNGGYYPPKTYTCLINSIPSNNAVYQPIATYQTLIYSLDVQYGPDPTRILQSYNKTIMVGSQTNFSCPFIGNPTPNFYWRIAYSPASNMNDSQSTDFSLGSQDYTVSRNLQVGSYVFECKAQVLGLLNNFSEPVQFYLNVIPQPTPVVKKIGIVNPESRYIQNDNGASIGAIVGGVIGGIALLILIIVVIGLFIKYGRNKRNSKDEIEKAKELDIDITDNNGSHLNQRKTLQANDLSQQEQLQQQQQQQQLKKLQNGLGNKVLGGLMVPNAQSYAAIAHAAAAAANQQRNNFLSTNNVNHQSDANNYNTGSSNNLLISNNNSNNLKSQSYNNPGFFESTSYSAQNPLESPPPYETALHQPMTIKKDSPLQPQRLNQQQKDYMGSNSRLISEANTPTQPLKHAASHSYTATPQNLTLTVNNSTPNHLQHLGFQNQTNLQYTSVHNLENRARSRNPLNGLGPNEMDPNQQQQQQHTQYSTLAAQLSSNPIDV